MDQNMDKIPGPLLYQILKFLDPGHFNLLEILDHNINMKLSKNISALQRILREKYYITKELSQDDCKKAIKDICCDFENPPQIFLAWEQTLNAYNCKEGEVVNYPKFDILPEFEQMDERYEFLSPELLFITGGSQCEGAICDQTACWQFNIITQEITKKASMNDGRRMHGIIRFARQIYVFGGGEDFELKSSAERYNIEDDTWHLIPSLPKACNEVECVRVKDKIFITSLHFKLISYAPFSQTYHAISEDFSIEGPKALWKVNDKFYVLLQPTGEEFDSDGQYIRNIDIGHGLGISLGMRYMAPDGKVYFTNIPDAEVWVVDLLNEQKVQIISDFELM